MIVQIASRSPGAPADSRRAAAPPIFRRVVVALDELSPSQGAFAQALEWATRLRLPVAGMVGNQSERVPFCASACEQARVVFQSIDSCKSPGGRHPNRSHKTAGRIGNPSDMVGSGDLLAFGHSLPVEQKKKHLHVALGESSPALLICPNHAEDLRRILLLDQGDHGIQSSLPVAAELCRAFGAKVIVLTVARSTKEGQRRQQAASDALANYGLDADFDLIMGSEVRAAVVCVAYWRRCQLVIMGRHVSRSWWRWLRDPAPDWFLNLVEPLCYLSVPESTGATR